MLLERPWRVSGIIPLRFHVSCNHIRAARIHTQGTRISNVFEQVPEILLDISRIPVGAFSLCCKNVDPLKDRLELDQIEVIFFWILSEDDFLDAQLDHERLLRGEGVRGGHDRERLAHLGIREEIIIQELGHAQLVKRRVGERDTNQSISALRCDFDGHDHWGSRQIARSKEKVFNLLKVTRRSLRPKLVRILKGLGGWPHLFREAKLSIFLAPVSFPDLDLHLARRKSLSEQLLRQGGFECNTRQTRDGLARKRLEGFVPQMLDDGGSVEDGMSNEESVVAMSGIKVSPEEETESIFSLLWELEKESTEADFDGVVELGGVVHVLLVVSGDEESI